MMLSRQVLQRSNLIGTPVITRDTNKKLGVISQLWVDIDQHEVMAFELKASLTSRTSQCLQLINNIHWDGGVILIDTEDVVENINVLGYNPVNDEVITETGKVLGEVRDFKFDISGGLIFSLIVASPGTSLIPAQLISTYELPLEEVISSSPERLIVFEGAEERLNQLTVGVLERLGISIPPWERHQRVMRYSEEPEPEEFYDQEEAYEEPKYEYVEEYDAWDESSDPFDDPPPSSPIGQRPWGPQSPSPLSAEKSLGSPEPPIP